VPAPPFRPSDHVRIRGHGIGRAVPIEMDMAATSTDSTCAMAVLNKNKAGRQAVRPAGLKLSCDQSPRCWLIATSRPDSILQFPAIFSAYVELPAVPADTVPCVQGLQVAANWR